MNALGVHATIYLAGAVMIANEQGSGVGGVRFVASTHKLFLDAAGSGSFHLFQIEELL